MLDFPDFFAEFQYAALQKILDNGISRDYD